MLKFLFDTAKNCKSLVIETDYKDGSVYIQYLRDDLTLKVNAGTLEEALIELKNTIKDFELAKKEKQ